MVTYKVQVAVIVSNTIVVYGLNDTYLSSY
jgi:hypothetical protein